MSFGKLMPWKDSKGNQEECYVVLRGVSRAKGVYALEKSIRGKRKPKCMLKSINVAAESIS